MSSFLSRAVLGWGIGLWLIGYVLGFVFYAFVPPALIGWYVMPLGILITVAVLWKRVSLSSAHEALVVGIWWSIIAIVADYIGIVQLLHPADGYYKLDVYLYYAFTFLLPLCVYFVKRSRVA